MISHTWELSDGCVPTTLEVDIRGPEDIAIALWSEYHDQYVDVVLTDKMAREFIAFIEQAKAPQL